MLKANGSDLLGSSDVRRRHMRAEGAIITITAITA